MQDTRNNKRKHAYDNKPEADNKGTLKLLIKPVTHPLLSDSSGIKTPRERTTVVHQTKALIKDTVARYLMPKYYSVNFFYFSPPKII